MFYLPLIYIFENQIYFIYEKGLTKLTEEQIVREITELMNRTGYQCNVVPCNDYKELLKKLEQRTRKNEKDYTKMVNALSQRFLDQSV